MRARQTESSSLRLIIIVCACTFLISVTGCLALSVLLYHELSAARSRLPVSLGWTTLRVQPANATYGIYDDAGWAAMFNHSPGLVRLGDGKVYAVSMFHQLHCLNQMRRTFVQLHTRTTNDHDNIHMNHCISYLRQMVLCAANTSLEPSRRIQLPDGTETSVSWSDGSVHRCRDWTHLTDWTAANYERWKDTVLSGHAAADDVK